MAQKKDPIVEFVRWATTAASTEVDLVIKLVKAARGETRTAPVRRPRRKVTDPATE